MSTGLKLAAQSHSGSTRTHNDDRFLVADLMTGACLGPESVSGELQSGAGFAFAVLSASGGFRWGDPGAEIASDAMCAALLGGSLPDSLGAAMRAASDAIVHEVARDPRRRGLSVVATLGVVSGESLHLVSLGDARAYLLRRGRLAQLTRDDTVENDAVGLGHRPVEVPPGVLTRALGYGTTVDAAVVSTVGLRAGDTILVCSRGLHRVVDAAAIERVLMACDDPATACDALYQLAVHAGARHDATILVLRPTSEALRTPTAGDMVVAPA